ncbi:GGDEF domain-containing protein [Paraglaciecola aquimarina]|uniref:diguanylate cyclase n=1 Tax=Paraglaciecola aquimarina TaxID=1235557 RepID=A0ABU3SW90_9ALTE|nr:GGDEF domain-containing protein [Paraglaciecola aquimarina]MDU0354285.1 GGDEF domain-containing protein [Paraglaciecola aquimarina]
MKFSENSDQAVDFLRQAVPTMMKYNIVPNPLNYTLWYSYYSNLFPLLNKELDETVERYGTCPTIVSETLFLNHISAVDQDNEQQLFAFQKILSVLVDDLSDSLSTTAKQTTDFSKALRGNVSTLATIETQEDLSPILKELSANANAICSANDIFQKQLTAAKTEINSLKEELDNSRREASTDPLTGLLNRRAMESIYLDFVEDSNSSADLTLVIMDIDKFKLFNDTHGHVLGDQILQVVGKLLKNACTDPVVAVRLGGEEFALLCPDHNLQEAHALAESIRSKLAITPYNNKRTGTKIPPITASFGIASRHQDELLISMIERADKSLYAAKEAGRNRVELAT